MKSCYSSRFYLINISDSKLWIFVEALSMHVYTDIEGFVTSFYPVVL